MLPETLQYPGSSDSESLNRPTASSSQGATPDLLTSTNEAYFATPADRAPLVGSLNPTSFIAAPRAPSSTHPARPFPPDVTTRIFEHLPLLHLWPDLEGLGNRGARSHLLLLVRYFDGDANRRDNPPLPASFEQTDWRVVDGLEVVSDSIKLVTDLCHEKGIVLFHANASTDGDEEMSFGSGEEDLEIDSDAEDCEFFRPHWSEAKLRTLEFQSEFDALRSYSYFKDDAAMEAAREALTPYLARIAQASK
ncbi:hypothetical protein JCM10212_000790 [Sporobolomyces blumeae]